MDIIKILLQVLVAIAIVNVWVLRKDRATPWRGGNSTNLESELETYGLNKPTMVVVGSLKLAFALLLVIGIWIPTIADFAATGLAILLLLAVIAHFKISDPKRKSAPALSVLAMTTAVLVL